MTLTRVTTSGPNRSSHYPSLSADGAKVAFDSDSDFLGQGIPEFQYEIWLYDTATMTLTRVTTSAPNRISWYPSLSADGAKVAFHSDSDFLGQGILQGQFEIWLFEAHEVLNLTKIVDDDSPEPGQGITYTVVVTNSDSISATGLAISDTTPLSLTFISGSTTITPPGNGSVGDAPTLVSGLTLTAGEQVTVTYQVSVPVTLSQGEVVTNTVSVTRSDMVTPKTAATTIAVDSSTTGPSNTLYLPVILKN